jgi:FkbH-like protein
MMLAAAVVAGLVYLMDWAAHWPWYGWLIASPVLYLCWLISSLLIYAATLQPLGKRFPKPRYKVFHPGKRLSKDDLGLMTAEVCYRRAAIVAALPLIRVIEQTRSLRSFVLRAYSPAVHVGKSFICWGYVYDPDLTEIGDYVVIGGRAAVVAHSMAIRQGGEVVYVSAPVKVGDRATIGGESRVALGCVIGADAIIEPGSVVAPFTRIPPGEVWGGNPARFRRRRDDIDFPDHPDQTIGSEEPAHPASDATFIPPADRSDLDSPPSDEIRRLVLDALDLSSDTAPAELSSESCPEWDSLGQIAISAAIFDRYGIAVEENEVYRIRTMQDIVDIIAKRSLSVPDNGAGLTGTLPAQFPSSASAQDAAGNSLPDDVEMLPLLDSPDATRALAARFQRAEASGQRLRVVIAASFTAQPVATSLKLWARAFGFEIDCRFAEYNQIVQTLLDERGPFATNRAGVNVILVRPEDLAAGSLDQSTAQLEQMFEALRHMTTGSSSGELLVGTLPPVVSPFALLDREVVESVRHQWRSRLAAMPGVDLFDFADVVERVGIDTARDSGTDVLMRAPYSPRLYQELGIALARRIRASRRAPAKVLAVDCDNTLWGGVVGEVGMEGIQLGPDGPGRAFQLFQRQLKHLKDRGLLLVVVSKNEEHDVRDVFERHPEMVLRLDDIAAWRVNWNHKSQNLRELAGELNLGLNAFVLLDDDPAVRLEVQARLPDVHVVPLPKDPAAYCETLTRLWLFDGIQATAVDAARTRMMQEEGRRQHERNSTTSLAAFLASLELRVEMTLPTEHEWPRVAQLSQRTNQFNLSLKRRTLEEMKALEPELSVCVLKARDRFGDYGLVGVGMFRESEQAGVWEIDTLLMSCRALGRGVEDAFLYGIAVMAFQAGANTLVAPFVVGPRNGQVRDFLIRSGFHEIEPNLWARSLSDLPPLPEHVEFHRSGDPALATRFG